jgi:hypothetical protein
MIQFNTFSPTKWVHLCRYHKSLAQGLGVRVVYEFSSIMDEGALVQPCLLNVEVDSF